MALFPFRNPITEATGCLGGIAIHMCTWSGIRCPSRIWHSFCRASEWKIGPTVQLDFVGLYKKSTMPHEFLGGKGRTATQSFRYRTSLRTSMRSAKGCRKDGGAAGRE